MEIKAISKSVRVSPRKVRLVADLIRNASVEKALVTLALVKKRACLPLEKTLRSALANASHNSKLDGKNLFVKRIEVAQSPALKRYHPSTKGRVHPYKRRGSHITIVLEERVKNGTES